jgi:RHS repeat-associated protein
MRSPNWLLGDHLGSTSMVANASGTVVNEVRYSAFGETRYQYIAPNETLRTDYLYTGQRQEAEIGLYYYVARWYDPAIGRFTQADSVVPNPTMSISFDRYGYASNNPINYLDPSGHFPQESGNNVPCLDGICSPQNTTWLGNLPETTLAALHQYQYDGSANNPNECAVTSLAMATNITFRLQGENTVTIQYQDLAEMMDKNPVYYRRIHGEFEISINGVLIEPGGATHPSGIVVAGRYLSSEAEKLGYKGFDVNIQSGGTTTDLQANLSAGKPTVIYGMNNTTPHAMVVVGYDSANDNWYLLDPARKPNANKPFREMNTQELQNFWVGWGLIYRDGVMITITPH